MRGAARPFRQRQPTLLRSLYANYLPDTGHIHIRHGDEWVDLVNASPRKVLEVRKRTIGWVSQFLRVIPRISALEVVMQPLLDLGIARDYLRFAGCPPADASGTFRNGYGIWRRPHFPAGEQQRVNIARGFAVDYPILLLDEPTASLDARNSAAVVELINEAKRRAAIVSIFHDETVRNQVADRLHLDGNNSMIINNVNRSRRRSGARVAGSAGGQHLRLCRKVRAKCRRRSTAKTAGCCPG